MYYTDTQYHVECSYDDMKLRVIQPIKVHVIIKTGLIQLNIPTDRQVPLSLGCLN